MEEEEVDNTYFWLQTVHVRDWRVLGVNSRAKASPFAVEAERNEQEDQGRQTDRRERQTTSADNTDNSHNNIIIIIYINKIQIKYIVIINIWLID